MKKHIIFDIDGTLLDTTDALIRSLQAALETVTGRPFDRESLGIYMGITGEDTLEQLGISDIPGTLRLWEDRLAEEAWRTTVFDGVPELLLELHNRGYHMGLVTSKDRKELDMDWDRIPQNQLFELIVNADDTKEHKPSPEPLLKYLEKAGITAEEALYIGDSQHDMLCAKKAGVDFALAGWGAYNRNLDVKLIIDRPEELLEHL